MNSARSRDRYRRYVLFIDCGHKSNGDFKFRWGCSMCVDLYRWWNRNEQPIGSYSSNLSINSCELFWLSACTQVSIAKVTIRRGHTHGLHDAHIDVHDDDNRRGPHAWGEHECVHAQAFVAWGRNDSYICSDTRETRVERGKKKLYTMAQTVYEPQKIGPSIHEKYPKYIIMTIIW